MERKRLFSYVVVGGKKWELAGCLLLQRQQERQNSVYDSPAVVRQRNCKKMKGLPAILKKSSLVLTDPQLNISLQSGPNKIILLSLFPFSPLLDAFKSSPKFLHQKIHLKRRPSDNSSCCCCFSLPTFVFCLLLLRAWLTLDLVSSSSLVVQKLF